MPLRDLRSNLVDVVTFGQYLRPTKRHMKVAEFVTPDAFAAWKREAESMGQWQPLRPRQLPPRRPQPPQSLSVRRMLADAMHTDE